MQLPSPSVFPCLPRPLLHGHILPCRCPEAGRVFLGGGSCWRHTSAPSMLAAGQAAGTIPRVPLPVDPLPCGSPSAWEKPASVVLLGAASSLTSSPLKMPSPRAKQMPQRGGGRLQPHARRPGWNNSSFRCIRSRKVPCPHSGSAPGWRGLLFPWPLPSLGGTGDGIPHRMHPCWQGMTASICPACCTAGAAGESPQEGLGAGGLGAGRAPVLSSGHLLCLCSPCRLVEEWEHEAARGVSGGLCGSPRRELGYLSPPGAWPDGPGKSTSSSLGKSCKEKSLLSLAGPTVPLGPGALACP